MTEHDLDALASDLLDGLLPADEAADALRDPAVARRVEEMRSAQALLRSVPAPDPHRREAAIAAALEAADRADAHPSPAAAPGPRPAVPAEVRYLAAHRARPRPEPRRNASTWLAAAAVILVVLAFGGLIVSTQVGSDDDADTSAAELSTGAEERDATASDDGGEAASEAAPTTTAPPTGQAAPAPSDESAEADSGSALAAEEGVLDLGAADSVDQLAERARIRVDALAPSASGDETLDAEGLGDAASRLALTGCELPAEELPAGATLEVVATATLDGDPVTVWLFSDGGTERMVVLDAACGVVGRRTLG
jgi:hypothetical protein